MVSGPFAPPQAEVHSKTRPPWIPLVWFGILLLFCYAPILSRLVLNWSSDQDMGHGFFVPLVAGYIVWQRRGRLSSIPHQPSMWGLALVVYAAVQALAGTVGAELFTARIAFVLSLTGILLYLGGKAWVKELAFPLLLLLFMIPIPQIVYARLTMHLQFLASGLAETLIGLMGIPVIRTGNVLELPHQTLNIVEACSGIRSLISLSFLSLVYAYFADKRVWMRWALLIATVPIAIAANAIRVALTGLLSQFDTNLAKGLYHEIEGYFVFMVALICLLAVHRGMSTAARRWSKAHGSA
ncbi:MAG TPA: exosortase [Bryobacteraceae bacterium]|nr:exosortase [Bryobacteraceae bacterium]